MFVSPFIFDSREGGWDKVSHRLVVFEMGVFALFLVHLCGEILGAMDLMLMAESFRLGVKRSNISLPWESSNVREIFGKKQRLIAAPHFVPEPTAQREEVTLRQSEATGKVVWSRVTSLIPWPVAQERALGRVLENWRIIITDSLDASLLGRQISSILDGTVLDMTVEQVIRDSLGHKAVSTLRSRASSLMAFARWKKSFDEESRIFPVTEEQAYKYVVELRQLNAPRTKPARFLESLAFAFHMIGADVGQCLQSPRLRGAVISPMVPPRKKVPLEVWQVAAMEQLAMDGAGQEAIMAGYICMVLHCRLRWTDGQYCQYEPYLDMNQESGFLECELYHHKNAGRQKQAKRLLPAACCVPGLHGDWATPWLKNRRESGLSAKPGVPTMPAPLAGGKWAQTPWSSQQATVWMREVFSRLRPGCPVGDIASHSLKATLLSWMAKCSCDEPLRRLAGYHVDPASKSALEYSRDAQAPVLHALDGILLIIREGLFKPDLSRAKRWTNRECRSLQEAMNFLASRKRVVEQCLSDDYEPESPVPEGWTFLGSEDELSISSVSDAESALFSNLCGTSDEDREAEVSAPIVGASIAQELHYSLGDVDVYRHIKSGCCHIAKTSDVVEEDGDPVILRCGKIATRNFEQVMDVGNFMPYKCTRCFATVSSQ